jgi:hypothetical protein
MTLTYHPSFFAPINRAIIGTKFLGGCMKMCGCPKNISESGGFIERIPNRDLVTTQDMLDTNGVQI